MTTDVEVRDNADRHRYEAHLDGTLAGYIDYQLATDLVVLTHTEVDESFEGRGVGSALARAALDDVHERCLKALVICPFITGWVRNHRVSTSTCSTAHRRARSPTDPAAIRIMVGRDSASTVLSTIPDTTSVGRPCFTSSAGPQARTSLCCRSRQPVTGWPDRRILVDGQDSRLPVAHLSKTAPEHH